ncbi:hypothetical protein V9T40_000076 [Parthenolecanium corni]|uniref:Uncharacterized protein n=1 Tax=Parthenolecanium corni TaxID=536013 RepID=A0AAN9TG82_9HEMI
MAKSCRVPANMKRDILVKALNAYYQKNDEILQSVLNEVKSTRAKKKKPKSTTARPRRKPKDNHCMNDGSDANVDSTSSGTKNFMPYNQYVNSNLGCSLNVDQSNLVDRLYARPHSAYMDGTSQYGSGYDYTVSSVYPSNYMSSSTPMMSYNGLGAKDSSQSYSDYNNMNYPSYSASSYYNQPCQSFSWMENQNSYYSMHDNYYSKLPSSECSSNLLPNVPQLNASVGCHVNESVSWNPGSVRPAYPNRVQFSPSAMQSYQENELPDDCLNFPATDDESINVEVDSASEADTRSLADDIADFLGMESVDQDSVDLSQQNPNLSQLNPSKFSQGGQTNLSTLSSEQSYYANSNGPYYASVNSANEAPKLANWSSASNVEKADATAVLLRSQTLPVKDDGFSLPVFSTLVHNSNTSTPAHNGFYSSDVSPLDDESPNDGSLIIDLDASPAQVTNEAAPGTSKATRGAEITNDPVNGKICNENDEVMEPRPNDVAATNLVSKNDASSQTRDASGLIYEKETLHRSKIICESSAKNGVKENVVRQYVKIFIPADREKAICNQTTKPKKVSDQVASSNFSVRQLQVLRGNTKLRTCWYKSIGCVFDGRSDIVTQHEKKCQFQMIYCPSESCSWRDSFKGLAEHISNYVPPVLGGTIKIKTLKAMMEFVSFPEKRRVKTWKGFIQPYSDSVDKRSTFNTMRLDVNGCEFIALYVCIC